MTISDRLINAVFVFVVLRQARERRLDARSIAIPLVVVALVTEHYVHSAALLAHARATPAPAAVRRAGDGVSVRRASRFVLKAKCANTDDSSGCHVMRPPQPPLFAARAAGNEEMQAP
jgi:hypothetical protein